MTENTEDIEFLQKARLISWCRCAFYLDKIWGTKLGRISKKRHRQATNAILQMLTILPCELNGFLAPTYGSYKSDFKEWSKKDYLDALLPDKNFPDGKDGMEEIMLVFKAFIKENKYPKGYEYRGLSGKEPLETEFSFAYKFE